MAENGELCRRVAQLERELNETRQAARGPQNKAQQLESEVNNMKGRNNEMERKYVKLLLLWKQYHKKLVLHCNPNHDTSPNLMYFCSFLTN